MRQLNGDLRAALLAMEAEDQDHRRLALDASGGDVEPAWSGVREIDRRNTARMREVITEHGWPGRSLVSNDGAHAAWLLVQHADHDRTFQRDCLVLLADAAAAGEASAVDDAYLMDRVAVAEGRPQAYGTQLRHDGDRYVPEPIDDPDHVDQRRAELGSPTLDEYVDSVNRRPVKPL
jgi:hypothetical protein